ncbi:MAG: low affinity iron permease family protein [Actinomycetota bacterium]|nr:low affinity iron permease family protein [Actinomycetota bacterium]
MAFVGLAVLFVVWLTWGVLTGFPRSWELAVTVGFPWVTVALLMVIQHAQNREARASHLKQNELLLSPDQPDAKVVDAEVRPDAEQQELRDEHLRRAREQTQRQFSHRTPDRR